MQLHDIPGLHYLEIPVSAAAADATAVIGTLVAPFKCRLKWGKLVSPTLVSGNGTNTSNYNVLTVAATVATERSHLDLGAGVDLVANTLTLLGTDSTLDIDLNEGDLIQLQREKVGTGTALAGTFVVAIQGA